ncbi:MULTISPECIES: murein L,D-transpeptidase family protein [Halomonadaceae]|uniref:L,D-transpeptidase family protein n=1 Tax=Halomonadaceae TaxID=28256 RepID=UPI00159A87B1|nr:MULTISPECIES: L,D-transpeptidase [Halomonas]QJQ94118.1 L,D-transpeptidase [Halomonas sp. PA5]
MTLATRFIALLAMVLLPALGAQANLLEHLQTNSFQPNLQPLTPNEVWVLVDDRSASLSVYRGEHVIEHFSPVSLGQRGAAPMRTRGDLRTPTGEFRIDRINPESRFHLFFSLDYPTPWHVRDAFSAGVISQQDYDDYYRHLRRYGSPPQDTILGGNIGIHGIGKGDPTIHEQFHWTQGCVAVTNEQIERLARLIGIGTRVVIR